MSPSLFVQGSKATPNHPASGIYYRNQKRKMLPDKKCPFCNAFAIGKNYIMTAAHCVFSTKDSAYAFEGSVVRLGKVGSKVPGKEVAVKDCRVPEVFKSTSSTRDYAVCRVDNIGSITPWDYIEINQLGNAQYSMLTYPLVADAAFDKDKANIGTPWVATADQLNSGSPNVIYLNCRDFSGDSGAAIFNTDGSVVAVNKGGPQGFIFITDIYNEIKAFIAAMPAS